MNFKGANQGERKQKETEGDHEGAMKCIIYVLLVMGGRKIGGGEGDANAPCK